MSRLTTEQKIAAVTAIQELIKQGVTQKAACKELGISPASFLKWGKISHKKARELDTRLSITDLPEMSGGQKLFLLYGDAAMLRQFMRETV
jgi:transposase-like protein